MSIVSIHSATRADEHASRIDRASLQRSPTLNFGYLAILHEPEGYTGGYLVVNLWRRPLEFRLSTTVLPSRVQQILYGDTLGPYICGELIGKTLVERTATSADLILTNCESALELRLTVETPIVWLKEQAPDDGEAICHPSFPSDARVAGELLARLEPALERSEPFARIREALCEARKLGMTNRG
jgi:hypothetical protein